MQIFLNFSIHFIEWLQAYHVHSRPEKKIPDIKINPSATVTISIVPFVQVANEDSPRASVSVLTPASSHEDKELALGSSARRLAAGLRHYLKANNSWKGIILQDLTHWEPIRGFGSHWFKRCLPDRGNFNGVNLHLLAFSLIANVFWLKYLQIIAVFEASLAGWIRYHLVLAFQIAYSFPSNN